MGEDAQKLTIGYLTGRLQDAESQIDTLHALSAAAESGKDITIALRPLAELMTNQIAMVNDGAARAILSFVSRCGSIDALDGLRQTITEVFLDPPHGARVDLMLRRKPDCLRNALVVLEKIDEREAVTRAECGLERAAKPVAAQDVAEAAFRGGRLRTLKEKLGRGEPPLSHSDEEVLGTLDKLLADLHAGKCIGARNMPLLAGVLRERTHPRISTAIAVALNQATLGKEDFTSVIPALADAMEHMNAAGLYWTLEVFCHIARTHDLSPTALQLAGLLCDYDDSVRRYSYMALEEFVPGCNSLQLLEQLQARIDKHFEGLAKNDSSKLLGKLQDLYALLEERRAIVYFNQTMAGAISQGTIKPPRPVTVTKDGKAIVDGMPIQLPRKSRT